MNSDQATFITYAGKLLAAHQEYCWKVCLWNRDDAASAWSQPAFWSMGFLHSAPWKPTWIGSDGRTDLFRKEFTVKKAIKRAWVYASALGLYELRLNGSKVGSDLFAPGWTDYRARVQYQRYGVTDLVKQGANSISAEIAPGWFAGRIAWFGKNMYGKSPSFAAQIHLEFSDDTKQVIDTYILSGSGTESFQKSYPGMKKWLAYLQSKSESHIIPTKTRVSKAGDWENVNDDTPKDLVGTFYYALDVAQLAEMAAAIGEDADSAAYHKQFAKIRAAISNKYFAEDGQVATGSQTAQVFALYLGLYPDGMREDVLDDLLENIKAHDDHLTTGYLGTQWLLKVLADNGRSDVAYEILLQKTGPSWLYMASNDQTSLWEGWDSLKPDGTFGSKRTSLGHSALGSVGDWVFQGVSGIIPDPASPGFKHFIIRPIPGGSLNHAEMQFESPHGPIATRWARSGNKFTLELKVPVNTTATVILPTTDASSITESHHPVGSADRVVSKGVTKDGASFLVGSGNYNFATLLGGQDSLEARFKISDKNGDGRLTREEFVGPSGNFYAP